jgi:hypothetical protein
VHIILDMIGILCSIGIPNDSIQESTGKVNTIDGRAMSHCAIASVRRLYFLASTPTTSTRDGRLSLNHKLSFESWTHHSVACVLGS